MKSFNETLTSVLKKDSRFVDEKNELIKTEIINEALKIDKKLIASLLSNKEVKEKFFTEIQGHWIFDINKFIDYTQDKNFLNDSYTKYKNKIGLSIGDKLLNERREIALSFPFKDCILEGGQTKEEDKRKEIFFNEILAQDEIDRLLEPKVLTNFKRYTSKGKEKVKEIKRNGKGAITENLILKGNNLLALYSIKKQYLGKIKLVYIDPPYNTGNDGFGYNDNFNHSTWLTFMKNRLEVSKDLLSEDGVIFISCDDNEYNYLKVLMDEIFGRENFENIFHFKVRHEDRILRQDIKYQKVIEQLLCYRKSEKYIPNRREMSTTENYIYKIEINQTAKPTSLKIGKYVVDIFKKTDYSIKKGLLGKLKEYNIRGSLITQKGSASEFYEKYLRKRREEDGLGTLYRVNGMGIKGDGLGYRFIRQPIDGNGSNGFYYQGKPLNNENKGLPYPNFYDMVKEFNNVNGEGNVIFKNGKKPEEFIKKIFEIANLKKSDIVLDYHLGSGTTTAVAHKMNLQYIGIEQLNYEENGSVPRLQNVIGKENYDTTGISKEMNWKGGGNFIYCELARYNDDFIEKIYRVNTTKALLEIWDEMKEKSFINYNIDIKSADQHINEFKQFAIDKQKESLISMLNKNQLYVNLSEIEDAHFGISIEDKLLTKKFYGYNDQQ